MNPQRQLRQLVPRIRRCLTVGLVLLGYLTAALGFPVPAAVVKDVSRPFPCQSHSCGCRTADDCWQSCCCYSAAEKAAWARAHQVDLPATASNQGWNSPRQRDGCTSSGEGCCAQGCCSPQATPVAPKQVSWVIGIAARQCHGLADLWLHSACAVPPAPPLTWAFEWTPSGWLAPAEMLPVALISSPPFPPPRV